MPLKLTVVNINKVKGMGKDAKRRMSLIQIMKGK